MRIESSSVQLASQSFSLQTRTREQRLQVSVSGGSAGSSRPSGSPASAASSAGDISAASADDPVGRALKSAEHDPKLILIKLMIEYLTGRKVQVLELGDLQAPQGAGAAPSSTVSQPASGNPASVGVTYDRRETYDEVERSDFVAQGAVRTADGREIQFSASLSLAREYHVESSTSIRLGEAARTKDPLVINLSGVPAALTAGTFSFDINADGTPEQLPELAPGSAFLALDKNGDAAVDNGTELFGPTSGNGFQELAALDQDGNGWLDQADAAYSQLRVWSKDTQGNDVIMGLDQAGVGAISVASAPSRFSLKDAANQLLGQVRATGVYLSEAGNAGTIQQIDLAV